eukprot:scaffold59273_cov20-Prasinocladus_malaysianus.AAC.1
MTTCLTRPYALGAHDAQKHKSYWLDECREGRTSWQGGVVRTGPRPWASRGLPYVGPMPMYPGLIIAAASLSFFTVLKNTKEMQTTMSLSAARKS